ncbi:malonate decarboxylase delta subunit [Orbus hercynius]|uniref:Malonate decarboxylase acyl carrier protein n=1 Tax=Orbus hercynius TaxID=593135 RepID=A0A495RBA7_9GAMM|nr:malonate decarboxylase acyl carrier protein [Orbus hercynius]RKS84464.1 malonate decarboxylase delta subunit [Orbus hercynius]
MERIELSYPATEQLANRALAGVVGSGDLEAMFVPHDENVLNIIIKTSVDGSKLIWTHLFERLALLNSLPKGTLEINDFSATPGVAKLRIEQVFEEARHAK